MTLSATSPAAPVHRARPVSAELLKLTSTRMWLAMLGLMLVLITVNVAVTVFAPTQPGERIARLSTEAGMRNLFGFAGTGYLFVILVGTLGMTQEVRHQTLSSTLLAEPRRNRVMLAKMVAYAIVGAVFGVIGVVWTYGLALALLPLKDHAPIPSDSLWQIAGGAVLGCAVSAVLGVAVGALVRNQIAAIVGVLAWVMLLEALVVQLLPDYGKWLPRGALNGILQTTGLNDAQYLPVWQATLLLLAYAAVFALAAAATTQRRDVT